ncbi:carbohydrate porin [Methylocapsa palsarum]|uniref:Porin n=1 Tax=Methylocapsa palsarum TaxID=1612308 RepID=A0A1I4C929_9HYPH|nr:carbohydrate porin [Methylocapsa palsarum]SFK77435.1 porin [Methylocapsa palsarum]
MQRQAILRSGLRRQIFGAAALILSPIAIAGFAQAQNVPLFAPQEADRLGHGVDQPSLAPTIPGLGELKKALLDRGITLQADYIAEAFGNPTGGVKQGANFANALYMALDANLASYGLNGANFYVNGYEINGRDLTTNNIYNLANISSINARSTARLYELWFEQKFSDWGSIRVGQLVADNEFFVSAFDDMLINGTFGWPVITAANLPSGGPGYPLTTPGVRIKLTPNEDLALLAAIYNGDPSGAGFTGLQEYKNPSGLNFRIQDPPLVMSEIQVNYNQEKGSTGLAGTAKFGIWAHFGNFADYHFDAEGQSLANPESCGAAQFQHGDSGVYGVVEQMLWRAPGDEPLKGVGVFGRVSFSPSDRNLIDFYADGGLIFSGVLPERRADAFGVGAAFSRLSPAVGQLDRDQAYYDGARLPACDYELVLEVTYQAQVIPGWTLQPDFQYVVHPGGGAINPNDPLGGRVPNAAVFGVRSMMRF